MSKTPEELAEDAIKWVKTLPPASERCNQCACEGYRAGYQAAQQWISVKDRLPDRDQEVLGYEKPFISTCLFWRSRSFLMEHQWELSNGRNCNPTHWMPLPDAPKEEK